MPPPTPIRPLFGTITNKAVRAVVSLAARADSTDSKDTPSSASPSSSSSTSSGDSTSSEPASTTTVSGLLPTTSHIHFGTGASPAKSFNNAGFLALFAILAATMCIATVWFFFWAKNGGFRWDKDDWEDYKSSVLRRNKDENGRTISYVSRSRVNREMDAEEAAARAKAKAAEANADSAVGSAFSDIEKSPNFGFEKGAVKGSGDRHQRRPSVMEYRDEQPAQVGGLNRPSDATRFDPSAVSFVNSNHSRSTASGASKDTKDSRKREKKDRDRKDRRERSGRDRRDEHRRSRRAVAEGRGNESELSESEAGRRREATAPVASSPQPGTNNINSAFSTPPQAYSRPATGGSQLAPAHSRPPSGGAGGYSPGVGAVPISSPSLTGRPSSGPNAAGPSASIPPPAAAASPRSGHRSTVSSGGGTASTTGTATPSRTASSYYAAYRAAAAAHDAARAGPASGLSANNLRANAGNHNTTSNGPTPAGGASPSANADAQRSSYPPSANRFLKSRPGGHSAAGAGQRNAGAGRNGGGTDDEDERLSTMLPMGSIHPNESASQIGTRGYWAAKRESMKENGSGGGGAGYRRYSRA